MRPESRRKGRNRVAGIAAAADCDLCILVINGASADHANDVAFAQAWDRWFQEHPHYEVPPAFVVVTGIDRPEFGGGGKTASRGHSHTGDSRVADQGSARFAGGRRYRSSFRDYVAARSGGGDTGRGDRARPPAAFVAQGRGGPRFHAAHPRGRRAASAWVGSSSRSASTRKIAVEQSESPREARAVRVDRSTDQRPRLSAHSRFGRLERQDLTARAYRYRKRREYRPWSCRSESKA